MAKKKRKFLKKKKIKWIKKVDELWSLAIRLRHKKCEICNKPGKKIKNGLKIGGLSAHHVISRTNYRWRHDLRNGLCLCTRCHLWEPTCSPHARAIDGVLGFIEWFKDKKPEQYEWYLRNKHTKGRSELTHEENYINIKNTMNTVDYPSYNE